MLASCIPGTLVRMEADYHIIMKNGMVLLLFCSAKVCVCVGVFCACGDVIADMWPVMLLQGGVCSLLDCCVYTSECICSHNRQLHVQRDALFWCAWNSSLEDWYVRLRMQCHPPTHMHYCSPDRIHCKPPGFSSFPPSNHGNQRNLSFWLGGGATPGTNYMIHGYHRNNECC